MTDRKKKYVIGSPEGAGFVQQSAEPGSEPPKVGDVVSLHLEDEKETALLAAGWLTTEDTGPKGGTK
jgi:hypothetical protein